MKKLFLILLSFFTLTSYGQAEYEKIAITANTTSTTASKINVQEANGEVNTMPAENIPVNISPQPINYNIPDTKLGSHLKGIDNKFGSLVQTTAGITNRIWFTGDISVVNAVNYFTSNATSKGVVTAASPTPLVNGDDQKQYFSQDIIGNAFPSIQKFPAGTYAGQLTVRSNPNNDRQRYAVEIYKTDNLGVPIASGITGAPIGDLGVTVVTILDSGEINLASNAITGVPVSGILASELTINATERIRYHVSAAKIGTAGGNNTMEVFYGSNYNSYYDVPVTFDTNSVKNVSAVTGVTTTDALNNLNIRIATFEQYGALGDGVTDDSAAIQSAINAVKVLGGTISVSNKTFICGDVLMYSNVSLVGNGAQSVLKFKSGAQYLMSINSGSGGTTSITGNEKNIAFRNMTFLGRGAADGFSQFKHLLNVNAVSYLTIDNCRFIDFQGDGIYIGSSNSGVERHNTNITINNCFFDGINKENRNAISVIDCDNLIINNSKFYNVSKSTMPAAIDIEPNNFNYAIIKNITIKNNYFSNIGGSFGTISVYLPMAQESLTVKSSNILIEGNKIENSSFGLAFEQNTASLLDSSPALSLSVKNNNVNNITSYPFKFINIRGASIIGNTFSNFAVRGHIGFVSSGGKAKDILFNDNVIRKGGTTDGIGVSIADVNRIALVNNIFEDCGNGSIGYGIDFASSSTSTYVNLTNNIFTSPASLTTFAIQKEASHTLTTATNISLGNKLIGVTGNAFTAFINDPSVGTANKLLKFNATSSDTYSDSNITDTGSLITLGVATNQTGKYNSNGYFDLDASATNMGRLGFNRNVSSGAIYNGSFGAYQFANESGAFVFKTYNAAGSNISNSAIGSTGRWLFNTTTDNGIDAVQVNGTISANAATTANQVVIKSQLDLKANIDSQTLTGDPKAPTSTAGDNDTSIATTAFVANAVSSGTYTPTLTGVTNITTIGTLENAYYTKIGNIVTVYVSFQVRPTATSANSEYTISLPVTRTSAPIAGTNCGEGMSFSGSDITLMRVRDMDTTKMQVVFTSINTTTGNASISFTYKTN